MSSTESGVSLRLPGVRMSAEEFVAVNFRLWKARPATRRNHWLLGAAVVLLSVSVGLDVYQHGGVQSWSGAVFLAVAVLYGLLRMVLVRYQLRRGYARNTILQQPIDFTLTNTTITGSSTLGQFSGQWSLIRRAVWTRPDWLLLYPTEAACYYLDLRQLEAPATASDVARLLTRHQIPQLQA